MSVAAESSSLDDFFAKKDKKKTKKMKNLAASTGDPTGAQLNGEMKKKKKEKSSPTTATTPETNEDSTPGSKKDAPPSATEPADEWIEIEDEADKDYSGLKIQSLCIEEEAAAKEAEAAAAEEAAASPCPEGPWKKIELAPIKNEKATTEVVSEAKEATPPGGGKYVPPSVRAAQRQAAQPSSLQKKRQTRGAPDVNSEEMFPTLGGPSRSARSTAANDDGARSYTSLHLQNKWDTLSRGGDS